MKRQGSLLKDIRMVACTRISATNAYWLYKAYYYDIGDILPEMAIMAMFDIYGLLHMVVEPITNDNNNVTVLNLKERETPEDTIPCDVQSKCNFLWKRVPNVNIGYHSHCKCPILVFE